MYVCMYVCMYLVCMYVCIYVVCMYVCIYVCIDPVNQNKIFGKLFLIKGSLQVPELFFPSLNSCIALTIR